MDSTLRLLTFAFSVRSSVSSIDERIGPLLGPFRTPGSGSRSHSFDVAAEGGTFEVRLDGTVAFRSRRVEGAIDWILWKASTEAIAGIGDRLAIHAGAVGWEGRCVLLPAPH